MTDEPDGVIVTMPVDSFTHPVGGSKIVEADCCGRDVWLSPGTVKAMQTGEYPSEPIWCIECANDNFDNDG